jgi:hypothetical protein
MSEGRSTAIDAWDPLSSESDPGMLVAAQRREIRNILKSYTGYYDLEAIRKFRTPISESLPSRFCNGMQVGSVT